MSGKAERISTSTNRLRKHQINLKELEALNRLRNTPRPVASSAFSGSSAAGDVGGQGNFLSLDGGGLNGPLSLRPPVDFSVEIDSNGAIDIGPKDTDEQNSSNIQLEDSQPNTFTLDTIDGATIDGQLLFVRTFAPSSTFTIAQGTLGNGGNIQTPDGTDVTSIGDLQIMLFLYDELLNIESNTEGTWRLLNTFGTGGGGLSEPVILTVNEITPETLPTTSIIDWSKNPNHITLDRDVEFSFSNLPANGKYEGVLVIIDIDATGGYASPVWPASLTNPPIVSTTALTRTSVMIYTLDGGTTVTHATSVGSSNTGFSGNWSDVTIDTNKDMLTFNLSNLASIASTDAAPAASGFVLMGNGEFAAWRNAGDTADLSLTVNSSDRFQFTGGPLVTDTNLGNSLGNSGVRWNTVWAQTVELQSGSGALLGATIGSTNTLTGTLVTTTDLAYAAGLTQTFSPDATNAGVNVGSLAGDPSSPNNGDIVYNTTAANFRFREAGAWIELGATPSTIIDGNTSFTANGTTDTLTGTFDGDSDKLLVFGQGSALYENRTSNYLTTYFRNDDTGVAGNFIQLAIHRGVDDQGTGATFNYFQTISSISDPANGSEDGKWLESIGAKGAEVTAYTLEGSTGLINTNVLHSFFGSMLIKSDQDGDDAILRLERNDTTPLDNDVIGVIQFHGEDSTGNDTQYGSISLEAADVSNLSENGRFAVDLINGALTERMIVADSLTNQITFSPTSDFDYFFDTTGFMLRNNTNVAIDTDFTPISFIRGITPLTYAAITPQVKESTDSGRLTISVRSDNASLASALVINGGNSNVRSYLSIPARITSNLDFGLIDETGSAKYQIHPLSAATVLGIEVQDNASYTVGDEGSLATPLVISGVSTTIAALDAAFGDHKGCEGFIEISSTLTKFVKQDNGNWGQVSYVFDAVTS